MERAGAVGYKTSWMAVRSRISLFIGDPTPAEIRCGVGTLPQVPDPGDEADTWTDEQWGRWSDTTPNETDVMRIAALWSVDPSVITDDTIHGCGGWYGPFTWHPHPPARSAGAG